MTMQESSGILTKLGKARKQILDLSQKVATAECLKFCIFLKVHNIPTEKDSIR